MKPKIIIRETMPNRYEIHHFPNGKDEDHQYAEDCFCRPEWFTDHWVHVDVLPEIK
jgi:hypothetical protein